MPALHTWPFPYATLALWLLGACALGALLVFAVMIYSIATFRGASLQGASQTGSQTGSLAGSLAASHTASDAASRPASHGMTQRAPVPQAHGRGRFHRNAWVETLWALVPVAIIAATATPALREAAEAMQAPGAVASVLPPDAQG